MFNDLAAGFSESVDTDLSDGKDGTRTSHLETEIQEDNNTSDKAKEVTEINQDEDVEEQEIKEKVTSNSNPSNDLKIHCIDVGQADSILIENGSNAMLIDAGNNADPNLVISYIKQQGIKKLNYVVGTHPHKDILSQHLFRAFLLH